MIQSKTIFKAFFLMLILSATSFAFTSCSNANASGKEGKEYTSAYVCPMHCKGSGSDQAGTCPVCKMDYVKNEANGKVKDAHDHSGHSHDGHDHSGHDHTH